MTDPIAVGAILFALVLLTMTIGARLMDKIDELKAAIDAYIAKVEAYKLNVAKLIEDAKKAAVEADDAEEAVRLTELENKVNAAGETLGGFEPSANA